jgi:hypothetical protein
MDKKKEKEEIEKYSDFLNTLIENKKIDNSIENLQNLTKNIQKLLTMEKGEKNYIETIEKINCKELVDIIDKGGKDYIKIFTKIMQKYLSKIQNESKSKNKLKIINNNNVFSTGDKNNNKSLIFYFEIIKNSDNNNNILVYLIVVNQEEKKFFIVFNKENEILLNFNMIQDILEDKKSNDNNKIFNIELKQFLSDNNENDNIEIKESLNLIKLKEKVEENLKKIYVDFKCETNLFNDENNLKNIIKNIINDKITLIITNNEKIFNKLYNN